MIVIEIDIRGLGYVGVRGDLDAWEDFATQVLGLQVRARTESRLLLRLDDRAHRIAVDAGEPGLAYIGWEVADDQALVRLEAALDAAQVPYQRAAAEAAAERGVLGLLTCADPAGNALELFFGPAVDPVAPFTSPVGARFVTADQGLGHLVIATDRYDETVAFYTTVLGFSVSDLMTSPVPVTFLGCNRRHHSIAVADSGGHGSALHHIMVEVDELRAVGTAYDRVHDRGEVVTMTLGQHWNDEMTSFYVRTPSGFSVEYGWGGRTIDRETWTTVGAQGAPSYWGHRMDVGGAA